MAKILVEMISHFEKTIAIIMRKKFFCIFINLKSFMSNPFILYSPLIIIVITASMIPFSIVISG